MAPVGLCAVMVLMFRRSGRVMAEPCPGLVTEETAGNRLGTGHSPRDSQVG